eukprot:TRINITY_DN46784_c0_g1_i1.p1 TRINITY_DN46784_c0_g1~~TRINITY_DN46784_c0_g1_i1.p1  ORF type:complete len:630 (+),score=42.27 TRINITY_DN46784_c0_g1_i1:141-2030(+)
MSMLYPAPYTIPPECMSEKLAAVAVAAAEQRTEAALNDALSHIFEASYSPGVGATTAHFSDERNSFASRATFANVRLRHSGLTMAHGTCGVEEDLMISERLPRAQNDTMYSTDQLQFNASIDSSYCSATVDAYPQDEQAILPQRPDLNFPFNVPVHGESNTVNILHHQPPSSSSLIHAYLEGGSPNLIEDKQSYWSRSMATDQEGLPYKGAAVSDVQLAKCCSFDGRAAHDSPSTRESTWSSRQLQQATHAAAGNACSNLTAGLPFVAPCDTKISGACNTAALLGCVAPKLVCEVDPAPACGSRAEKQAWVDSRLENYGVDSELHRTTAAVTNADVGKNIGTNSDLALTSLNCPPFESVGPSSLGTVRQHVHFSTKPHRSHNIRSYVDQSFRHSGATILGDVQCGSEVAAKPGSQLRKSSAIAADSAAMTDEIVGNIDLSLYIACGNLNLDRMAASQSCYNMCNAFMRSTATGIPGRNVCGELAGEVVSQSHSGYTDLCSALPAVLSEAAPSSPLPTLNVPMISLPYQVGNDRLGIAGQTEHDRASTFAQNGVVASATSTAAIHTERPADRSVLPVREAAPMPSLGHYTKLELRSQNDELAGQIEALRVEVGRRRHEAMLGARRQCDED